MQSVREYLLNRKRNGVVKLAQQVRGWNVFACHASGLVILGRFSMWNKSGNGQLLFLLGHIVVEDVLGIIRIDDIALMYEPTLV